MLLSLKMFRSRTLASFVDHCCLPRSLVNFYWAKATAMSSFQLKLTLSACARVTVVVLYVCVSVYYYASCYIPVYTSTLKTRYH